MMRLYWLGLLTLISILLRWRLDLMKIVLAIFVETIVVIVLIVIKKARFLLH